MSDKTLPTIKKKYRQPMGCYSCIHMVWIDNPNPEPGALLVPACLKGYDGIMKNYFRINQSKYRGPKIIGDNHLTLASNPSCMTTIYDTYNLTDDTIVSDEEE